MKLERAEYDRRAREIHLVSTRDGAEERQHVARSFPVGASEAGRHLSKIVCAVTAMLTTSAAGLSSFTGFALPANTVIRVFSIDTRGQDVAAIEPTRPSTLCFAIGGARSQ